MLDLNVVIAGSAGEGVQTIGEAFARSVLRLGYPVFTTQEYESRIRGGHSSYRVRITENPRNAPRPDADLLLALNDRAVTHYRPLLREGKVLLAEEGTSASTNATGGGIVPIPFVRTASERFGTPLYANAVAAGALVAALGAKIDALEALLRETFERKGDAVIVLDAKRVVRFGKVYPLSELPDLDEVFGALTTMGG